MAPSDIGKALQGISGVLGAVGGIFAAVVALNDQLRQGWEVLNKVPAWGWAALAVVLLLLGVWQLIVWRQKRSELVRPEALRLERDNPEHLVGREDDIAALEQKCRGHALVFLEGESGSGKSALVQAGLLPQLHVGRQLLPLTVSIWGTDWERGPQRELADELWARLDAGQREKLNLTAPPEPEVLATTLGAMRRTIGVTPLFVFDQFDDYQARHRGKFLPGQRKSWLPARRLKEANAFWRAVADLCGQQVAHALVVTRSDTAAGLESVRFLEPETHRLDRLQTAFVAPLLARLAGTDDAAAIRAPERGWDRLRQRLARDLERDGLVLPQQLRSALAGLRGLRYLTVADYERVGGLGGLEARLVEREVRSAARTSGLTESTVRRLLLAMVDPDTGWKTVARPLNELITAAGDPKANEGAVRSALDQLRSDGAELVRRRIDPDTRSEAWLLDHDYLTRGIVAAERNANRWRAVLEEGARTWAEAGSLTRRWRALLKPSEQVALLWARARGRFIYGPHKGYAGKSVARFVPYLVLVAMIMVGGVAYIERQARERAAAEANAILQHLLLAGDALTHNEIDALWSLASTEDERVRDSFAQQLLNSTTFAERFNRKPDPVVRALAGLSSTRADRLGHGASSGGGEGDLLPQQVAAINLGLLLAPTSVDIGRAVFLVTSGSAGEREVRAAGARLLDVVLGLDPTEAQAALEPVLTAMTGTTDPDALRELALALQVLPAELTDAQARAALEPMLTGMQGTTDSGALRALVEAYQALAAKLTDAQAQAALEPVLTAMKETTSPFALQALALALQALAAGLTDAQAQTALEPVLTAMQETDDSHALRELALALRVLPVKLTDAQAQAALEPMLPAMQDMTSADTLQALVEAHQALAAKLTDAQAQTALDPVLTAMQGANGPYVGWTLAQAYQAYAAQLTDAQAQAALDPVLTAIEDTTEPLAVPALVLALQALPAELTDAQARAALERVLAAMRSTINRYFLWALGQAVQALAAKLTDAQAQAALELLLTAMKETTSPFALQALALALQALPARLTDAQAQTALEPVLTAIEDTTDPDDLQALALALQALAAGLTDAQAQTALEPVLTAIEDTTDPDDFEALALALQALPAGLTDAQAQTALEPVLTAIEDTTDPDDLQALALALQALAAGLTDAQAQAALDPVLMATQGTTDPNALQALALALQALAAGLTDAQAQAALDPVLMATQGMTDPNALQALAQAIQTLAPKLGARAGAALAGSLDGLARSRAEDTAKSFLKAADAVTGNDSFDQFATLAFTLLKYPTLTGEAEAYLLQRLRERSGGEATEAVDLWSAVGWAERRGGIDLDSPPQRPELPEAMTPGS